MATQKSIERAAQCWCEPRTSNIGMIPDLAEVFAEALDEAMSMNICVACRHHLFGCHAGPPGPPSTIWYNHFCLASPVQKDVDPVTGRVTGNEHAFCRDINTDGRCRLYEHGVATKGD